MWVCQEYPVYLHRYTSVPRTVQTLLLAARCMIYRVTRVVPTEVVVSIAAVVILLPMVPQVEHMPPKTNVQNVNRGTQSGHYDNILREF